MLYAKGFHTSKVILTFSIYLFHFSAGRKKIIACARNLRQNLYSYLLLKLQLFAFVNVLVSFWQTRNNNESTKHIILQSLRQTSKKFLNNCVNAFTAKKIHAKPLAICWQKKPDASVCQKFFKKIASRCDSSKILHANKLCRKLDCVIPAFNYVKIFV